MTLSKRENQPINRKIVILVNFHNFAILHLGPALRTHVFLLFQTFLACEITVKQVFSYLLSICGQGGPRKVNGLHMSSRQ